MWVKGGQTSKIALVFQESGDMVAVLVSFYSVSIDIQNHFHSNKTSSTVKNSGMNGIWLVWSKTVSNPNSRQTAKVAARLIFSS